MGGCWRINPGEVARFSSPKQSPTRASYCPRSVRRKTAPSPKQLARPPAKGTTTLQAEPGFFAVPSYRDPSNHQTPGRLTPPAHHSNSRFGSACTIDSCDFPFSSFSPDARQAATMSSFEQVVSNHRRHHHTHRPAAGAFLGCEVIAGQEKLDQGKSRD
jgi:hypothetical protein